MATVALAPRDRQFAERKFYTRMAILLVAVVFLGFAPSFYLRGIVPSYPRPNPTLTPFIILHGLLFTAWMAVLVAQTQLIAARQHKIHMRLGAGSMLLAIAMIPVMYLTAVWQVARATVPPFSTPLDWTALPLGAIPAFGMLVALGWRFRRKSQWHKRLMLGAAMVVALGPGFGRLPLTPPSTATFVIQMALTLLFFVPLFIWDRRSLGHVHPASWIAFGLYTVFLMVPVALIATGTWAPIARHLPGIGA